MQSDISVQNPSMTCRTYAGVRLMYCYLTTALLADVIVGGLAAVSLIGVSPGWAGFVSEALMVGPLLLFFSAFLQFRKGRYEFGISHAERVARGEKLVWIALLLPLLVVFLIPFVIVGSAYSGIGGTGWSVSSFLLAMSVLAYIAIAGIWGCILERLARHFTTKRQQTMCLAGIALFLAGAIVNAVSWVVRSSDASWLLTWLVELFGNVGRFVTAAGELAFVLVYGAVMARFSAGMVTMSPVAAPAYEMPVTVHNEGPPAYPPPP